MTTKKLTNKQALEQAIGLAENAGNVELAEKLGMMLKTLENKSSSKKPTKKQIENQAYKDDILEFLQCNEDNRYTITEILKGVESCNDFSNQKVTSLVKGLVAVGLVERIEDKNRSYFKLAKEN